MPFNVAIKICFFQGNLIKLITVTLTPSIYSSKYQITEHDRCICKEGFINLRRDIFKTFST